jgi:N-acyl-D-amino-acid deacylase
MIVEFLLLGMYDIIIKNGTVIDGTGKPMFRADVGIQEERIKEIGKLEYEKAHLVIDATDQYVSPGFIDVNNHSDTYWRIFLSPGLESLVYQGITTIVGGNCGSSLAPLVHQDILETIQKWVDIRSFNLDWLRMKDFLNVVEKQGLSVNFGTLVGHSTLRRGIIGDAVRSLSYQETKTMAKMLDTAMKEGALGLSTGLVYTHAKLATEEEIVRLAEVVAKQKGVYVTHVRGEAGELMEAVEEAIKTAQVADVKLEISHLKAMGEANWSLMENAISMVQAARNSGLNVNFDIYPYTSTGSVLYILLPDWVAEGGKKMMISRLRDPEIKKKVIQEMQANSIDYSKVTIAMSRFNKTLTKRKITEIAFSQQKTVEEIIVDILVASEGRVVTIMELLSEKNVTRAIQNPFSIISSNGAGYPVEHSETGELVHPRSFGTFPRVLGKYVREMKILSWEEAINKMTGKPAEKYGLEKRGVIAQKNYADIAVFNPHTVRDISSIDDPYQYSQGISWLLVNGKVTIENGLYNGARGGEVIRK